MHSSEQGCTCRNSHNSSKSLCVTSGSKNIISLLDKWEKKLEKKRLFFKY